MRRNVKPYVFLLSLFVIAMTIVISCKKSEDPIETTGHIAGTVTEDGSNTPIEAAEVVFSGVSSTYKTGKDGKFEAKELAEGDYTITVQKAGYVTNKKQVTVRAGRTQSADFSLKKEVGMLGVSPSALGFGTNSDQETLTITNSREGSKLLWEIVIPDGVDWLSVFPKSGETEYGESTITVSVDRSKMTEAKVYSANLIVRSSNGGGSKTILVTTEKLGATLQADPTSLNFGTSEVEKSIIVKNATQIDAITYNTSTSASWIALENPNGTISGSEVGTIKVKVARLGLSAGNHTGSVIIKSNKNTVTVNVSMNVLAKQAPSVSALQSSEVKHNSIGVSAYISDVGSAAVTAYGFCWGTSPSPTTADNKNNLGGTSTAKTFNSVVTGLTPNTLYYVRAYAINEEGTSYSDAISVTTLAPPTLPVVRTFVASDVKYNEAMGKGSIDDLGDGYVTSYGFCISKTSPNPTLQDNLKVINLGSITTKGNFEGEITGLEGQNKYFIRAYATNSLGTTYGGTVEITTPVTPPLVTGGLIAYYTFDNENCDDYFGEENYYGILQGTGQDPTFVTDIPGTTGKAMKCLNSKYYRITKAPDAGVSDLTFAVWVKTSKSGNIYYSDDSNSDRIALASNNRVIYKGQTYGSPRSFNIDLSRILFDGKWHHITITKEGTERKLYIDGRLYETLTDYRAHGSIGFIGVDYEGLMDNLRIYNRALTQEEIRTIYNAKQ